MLSPLPFIVTRRLWMPPYPCLAKQQLKSHGSKQRSEWSNLMSFDVFTWSGLKVRRRRTHISNTSRKSFQRSSSSFPHHTTSIYLFWWSGYCLYFRLVWLISESMHCCLYCWAWRNRQPKIPQNLDHNEQYKVKRAFLRVCTT